MPIQMSIVRLTAVDDPAVVAASAGVVVFRSSLMSHPQVSRSGSIRWNTNRRRVALIVVPGARAFRVPLARRAAETEPKHRRRMLSP